MARVLKIDNATKKRFSQKNEERPKRELKVYFLIVCEGKMTESNYFEKFKIKSGNVIFIPDITCEGKGYNTERVVEEAIKIRDKNPDKYDRVWAVFDKDDFPDNKFNSAIQKAKENNINCAWSNQAFELWYLLHFQYRNTAMSREEYQKAIEDAINKNWKNKKKPFKYAKNAVDMYEILEEYGNQTQAITNAERLSGSWDNQKFATHNPRTQVYELVKQLIGKDEVLNKEIRQKMLK